MIRVHFGQALRDLTGGQANVEVEASTVRELFRTLDAQFPGIGERLEHGTSVAINGEIIADARADGVTNVRLHVSAPSSVASGSHDIVFSLRDLESGETATAASAFLAGETR